MNVKWYTAEDAARWDEFVANSDNGTFLHSRRYLSYHDPERIRDRSIVIFRKGNIVAALPACEFPSAGDRELRSHGGLTYGGLIFGRSTTYEDVVCACDCVVELAREAGYHSLIYKPVPLPFQRRPRQEDKQALWSRGARFVRIDIASAVYLADWNESLLTSGRRQAVRKFENTGTVIELNSVRWDEYWRILEEVLGERHGARPTHSLEEMCRLSRLCPDNIALHVVLLDGRVIAGIVEYYERGWIHTQYMANTAVGRSNYALDGLLGARLHSACAAGIQWYSFGSSMQDGGQNVNKGLLQYKESLGAVGVAFETMEMLLD